jgi:hypothetical protein
LELTGAGERWDACVPGSEGESEAEEVLESWLHVGELLISLCQTILANCPTVSVFLAVMSPSGTPPENVDEKVLQAVLADVAQSLGKLCQGRSRPSTTVPMRAATLVGNVRALKMELQDFNTGPPPATLRREEICPPGFYASASGDAPADQASSSPALASSSEARDDEVLTEVVGLFSALADLEADPEWKDVSELDGADAPLDGNAWEFDAEVFRQKRKDLLEKAELDRKAKRQKMAGSQRTNNDRDARQDDRSRRDAPRSDKVSFPRDRPTTTELAVPETKPPEMKPPEMKPPPVPAETPAAVAKPPDDSAKELARFVKDHPHFMRVLQNPKKCLSDPRVKNMFVTEVQQYPQVKAFLEKKGLNLS